ncbi:MAG: imidazole glycerol phosphate synthase subunit HisH [Spirochaetes bacterium]|nr:imidazole glycerol phosphate synthase subunit HisH [Spirochaetota bacterium]
MLSKKIAIIDYKMGNLHSVFNAFQYLKIPVEFTHEKEKILNCAGIVLPGVGAFGDAMKNLQYLGLVDLIKQEISSKKPYLGICLGLQLLFEQSEECRGKRGLNIFKGKVVRFRSKGIKVPHIGWNQLCLKKKSELFKGIQQGSYFYFVHSYYVAPEDKNIIATTTEYGEEFVSSISLDRVFGVQFHPEKSQDKGMEMIKNFARICLNTRRSVPAKL